MHQPLMPSLDLRIGTCTLITLFVHLLLMLMDGGGSNILLSRNPTNPRPINMLPSTQLTTLEPLQQAGLLAVLLPITSVDE